MMGWQRHVRGALVLFVGLAGAAHAQPPGGGRGGGAGEQEQPSRAGIVTGTVLRAATQSPLAGAQVFVVGAQVGAITNEVGRFTISGVPAGERVVRFQHLGYGTTERRVTVPENGTLDVQFLVQEQAIAIDQVVVTALGIQRAEKSLGYAVQSVPAAALARSGEVSFVSALAGQTAGTLVTQSTGQPGGSARLVIRGEGSFRGDGQPLFVIDGVPIISDIDRNGYDPLARGEASSRVIDIDPANIEEITILRGAAATALYGSRAALGAVIVRTKVGSPGAPLRFTFSSRVGREEPILEGLQTAWAQGVAGYYCNGRAPADGGWCQPGHPDPDPVANLSWGPHRDSIPSSVTQEVGPVRLLDPREEFYESGLTSTQSLYGTGSIATATYGLGFSWANHEGVFTNSRLDRLNLTANMHVNMTRSLSSETLIMYSNTANDLGWEGLQGLTGYVSILPPSRDLSQAYRDDGTPVMFGNDSPHPRWIAENEYETSSATRWIASQRFAYNFGPGLTISNQIGFDTYLDDRREYQNERPWLTALGQANGGTRQQKITRRTINNDLVLSMTPRSMGEGPITISGLAGANIFTSSLSDVSGWGENLAIPGFYNLSNFATRRVTATLPSQRRLMGLYAQATLDYRDWAFLTLTGRNDWSSTLPEDANSFFYPSASLALLFTEALGWRSSLLDWGKVRLSVSKVGSDAPPYRLNTPFILANYSDFASGTGTSTELVFPFRAYRGFVQSTEFGNPEIKPERTVEMEAGLETQLLNGRARMDLSLYHRRSYDQIFSVPTPSSTGFTSVTQNAGDLKNRGIELSVGATPVRNDAITWDVRLNLTRNWSEVEELAEDVDFIYLAGPSNTQIRLMEGYGYGVIWGSKYQRNDAGQLLIGGDGWPLLEADPGVIGEIQPTWLTNLGSSFQYRGVTLSGLLDVRRGGQILNGDLRYTIPAGTAEVTEQRNDGFTWAGVDANTGQSNTVELVRDQAFWTRFAETDENLVESANVVRLREATVTFALPGSIARSLELQSISVFATGRNLAVWSPFSYGDPDGSNYGAINAGGQGYRLFTVPTTRTWSLGARATF